MDDPFPPTGKAGSGAPIPERCARGPNPACVLDARSFWAFASQKRFG